MKLETQVASLDLSKRLKELGVAARGYFKWHFDPHHTWELCRSIEGWGGPEYAAFTVAELGEMLPASVTTPHGYAYIESVKWMNGEGVELRYKNTYTEKRRVRFGATEDEPWDETKTEGFSQRCATEADARAKMLIHLLENKLTTVEEVNSRLAA